MLEIQQIVVGPLQTNCYLLCCPEKKECVVIDPGWSGAKIFEQIQEKKSSIKAILLTHTHFDHVGGVKELLNLSQAPLLLHAEAGKALADAHIQASLFGLRIDPVPEPESFIDKGEKIPVGNSQLEVLYTPGHAQGHVCFYARAEKMVFVGDVLFNGGIGRTDFPGGDYQKLIKSIHENLMVMPDDVVVYPGHGPTTQIGIERRKNPFLNNF